MPHCQFYHKSKVKKGKFTHVGGSSVKQAERNANQAFNDEQYCLNILLQRMMMHFGRRGVKDIVHPV